MNVSVLYDVRPLQGEGWARPAAKKTDEGRSAQEEGKGTNRWRRRLARMGVAGVLFFTVKGLLWLIVPAVAAKLIA